MGPAARPAADDLRKALDDPDENVRRTAAEILLALE
jgi:HEAT repeat protein